MNPSAHLHRAARRHHAAHGRGGARRSDRLHGAAGLSAAAGGFSDDHRGGLAAGREPGHHGVLHRDAARTGVRPHRGRDGDDLGEQPGDHQHYAAVRFEPRYQRRRARRGGGHQRGAHLSAREPAGESDLSQGESRRFAHSGAGPAVGCVRRADALRRSVHRDLAAHLADLGRRPGDGGGRIAAGRSHRTESEPARQLRHQPAARCSRSSPGRTRTRRKGRSPTGTRRRIFLPTIRSRKPSITSRWWWDITTEAWFACRMSPM